MMLLVAWRKIAPVNISLDEKCCAITFNGDYVSPTELLQNSFRPLRNPHSEFLDAA